MEHVPVPVSVTVLPETVQTAVVVDVKPTARPEVAVAPMANGAVPVATLGKGANAMVCAFDGVMVKERETGGAAEY